ncbi:aminotransferase class IV [Algivirga pacifica]|uniref:branched-chain-amino-acid transaminase n=1 Tax=Algivirga pacifica TaxID=1162670 RepID=A0ABP9DDI2_9BACT
MFVNYNFELLEKKKVTIPIEDRGFAYGDGLFETIIMKNDRLQFAVDHLERLQKGMKVMGFDKDVEALNLEWLLKSCRQLKEKNKFEGDVRFKLMVWRRKGGLYTPTSQGFHVLLTARDFTPVTYEEGVTVDFCERSFVQYSAISFAKTLSSMTYVLAGIEKKEKQVDDLVLMNSEGYLCEFISSALFWVKNDQIYTPRLQTGCVAGIARKNIIQTLEDLGYKVKKVMARKQDLLTADCILSANVAGVHIVKALEGRSYKSVSTWKRIFQKAYYGG